MGFVAATSSCFGCKQVFSYNPMRVPSIVVDGTREPVCARCVERANAMRRKNGKPLIVPLPDAYDACDESEIP